jgi:hypothetical protein
LVLYWAAKVVRTSADAEFVDTAFPFVAVLIVMPCVRLRDELTLLFWE